jgi:protein-S-isoprenylcysteine O-methyltransferase Ste14
MKILIALLFFSVFLYSFGYNYYKFLVPISYLENQSLKIVGLILIHLALIWICIAQYQMSTSWRIGIDEENDTELITQGIFSISRNPIFLGMILSVLGLFIIIPNALTFFLTLSTYFIIQIQIRLEEEFLEKKHREAYSNYKLKTNRLI